MTSKELIEGCLVNTFRMSSIGLKRVVADAQNSKKQNIGRVYAKVRFSNADCMLGMEDTPKTKIFWAETPVKSKNLEGKEVVENQAAIDAFIRVWKQRMELITAGDIDNPSLLIKASKIAVPVDAHHKLRNSVGPSGEPVGSRFKYKDEKGLLHDKVYHDINVFILFDSVGNAMRDPIQEAMTILNNPTNCTRVSQVNSAKEPLQVTPAVEPVVSTIPDIPEEILGSAEDASDDF